MPTKGVLGSTALLCSALRLLQGQQRGRGEQISYENYTLAFPLRETLSVHPGGGLANDKWVLMGGRE